MRATLWAEGFELPLFSCLIALVRYPHREKFFGNAKVAWVPNILKRIIILAPLLAVLGCGSSDLPVITQIPSAASSPFSLQRNSIATSDGLVTFASTGAECGIDEREVATMVYLPENGELGEGLIGCSVMRAPARVRDRQLHQELWEISKALIPNIDEGRIKRVILAQDRRTDTLAFVASLDNTGQTWEYGLNLDAVNLNNAEVYEELLSTIVHEYAHILSLNDTQVSYDPAQQLAYDDLSVSDEAYEAITVKAERNCLVQSGIYDGDACYLPGSHLFEFFMLFWDSYGNNAFEDAANGELFRDNRNDFVNSYAASSPTEDFAETFAAWVMPELEAFEITAVTDTKFSFFNSRPALVDLREQILDGLDRLN